MREVQMDCFFVSEFNLPHLVCVKIRNRIDGCLLPKRREQVQKRRAQLVLRKKRILIPELPEGEAGEIFLGEIGKTEDDSSKDG